MQYHSHNSHTHPWIVIADDREFLCGGDPPRGPSDETTSLGQWVQGWKGSQLQAIKPLQLDDFCSANKCLQEGQQGCGRTGRTARRNSERSKPSNSISNRSQGIVFHPSSAFSGGPVTRSKRRPVDVWSNHACQLALFFPGVRTAPLVGRSTSFFPGLRKCTPRQKGHVNQQAASFQRPPKEACPGRLAVTGLCKECTLLPR